MEILSGYDILVNKKKAKNPSDGSWMNLMLPIQFVSDKDKTPQWASQTMNFIETQGMLQLRRNLNWLQKNYELANNQIDKRDYIPDKGNNEYTALLNKLTENNSSSELRSIPFIQLVINTLCNERAERPSKISFSLLDEKSMDEKFEAKQEVIEKVLLAKAAIKQAEKMKEMGLDESSDQGQQMMAPETLKSLPEIQDFYTKSYRSEYQEWAEHQMIMDNERFYFDEQIRLNFRDSLIADRCFWELQMKEDDYNIRRWNPKQVFYRKSPNEKYIQNGQWVGHLDLLSVPDVLDMYGWMMNEEQQLALNRYYPAKSAMYAEDGMRPENMWDVNQSYEFNRTGPGIGARQLYSVLGVGGIGNGDITNELFSDSEDMIDTQYNQMIRVSTMYWKSQRHMFELCKVDSEGNFKRDLVTENYVVTDEPIYNTLVYKDKTESNLVFGERLTGLWINEVYGGVKIGPNLPMNGWTGDSNGFTPMYLGVRGGKPSRLPFQFKGEKEKWDTLLPVAGAIFSDNNTHSRSLVDNLKIYQIGVNMCANQMLDLMVDELGVIIAFDPRTLPKHSMGEDWGPDPFPKAYTFMKDFSMIPIDTSAENSPGGVAQNHFQKLDLSQSQRFLTKIKLFQWFKEEGLASVGLNSRRTGQPIEQEETATGAEMTQASSYSSTEHYFTQFDELLVRFHQMRTDCAQFYNSTKPSVRLQYTTSTGMEMWFKIDGRKLQGRDFGSKCISSPHSKSVLAEIKKIVIKNNTTDTSLSDLIRLVKTDDLPDIEPIIKSMDQKRLKDQQAKQQQEQQLQQQQEQHQQQLQQQKIQNDNQQKDLDRQVQVEVANIQASSRLQNPVDNSGEVQKNIQNQTQHNEKMDFDREKEINRNTLEKNKLDISKQKMTTEEHRTNAMLQESRLKTHISNKKKDTK